MDIQIQLYNVIGTDLNLPPEFNCYSNPPFVRLLSIGDQYTGTQTNSTNISRFGNIEVISVTTLYIK